MKDAKSYLMGCPSMEPQPFCALPWCGKTGAIDGHHVVPRSQGGRDGPQVYICHSCHMGHHDGTGPRLHFSYFRNTDTGTNEWFTWTDENTTPRALVVYDPTTDVPGDREVEETLGPLADDIRKFKGTSDTLDYYLGKLLGEAEMKVGDRKRLGEWCSDEFSISPRAVGSWLSKRISYGQLDELPGIPQLGITNGYLLVRVMKKHPDADLQVVLGDFCSMPKEQFREKYDMSSGGAKVREVTCPQCGTRFVL